VPAGYTWSYGAGERDMWLVKTDPAGNQLWSQTYGGAGAEFCFQVIEVPNREYVLVGFTMSCGAGGKDVYVVRTRSDDSVLPVTLLSFNGEAGDQQVWLRWTTGSESALDHFEIARNGNCLAEIPATNSPS
jgi:hypothetical protein